MAIRGDTGGVLERATQLRDGPADDRELASTDPPEDGPKQLSADRIYFLEHSAADIGHADEDDTAVFVDPGPFDEPALFDAIDEASRVRQRHMQDFRQAAHRHLAAPLEGVEDVELRHADAETQESLARSALDLVHRGPEVGDDGGVRVVADLARWGSLGHMALSSYHMNNLIALNHRVNLNR